MVELAQLGGREEGSLADPPATRPPTPRWAWVAAAMVGGVAAGRMVLFVLRSHRLAYADYWPMLDSMLTADGGFRVAGVFEFRNEHPVVIAKLLYWANLQLTGGSNVVLGLVIIAVVLGQLAVVVALARDLAQRWTLAPALVVGVASVLLFARQGAWHFGKSMSGASWLTADLFALLALSAQYRGRRFLAIAWAALATVSYGTGLATWPALLAVGFLSGERARRLVPTLGAAVVAVTWFQWQLSSLERNPSIRPSLAVLGAHGSEVIGAYFFPAQRVTSIRVGEAILGLAVAAAVVAVVRFARSADPAPRTVAPWVGLMIYGAAMALLVAGGRSDFLWKASAGRYAAIGALTSLGLVGAAAAMAPPRPGVRLPSRLVFAGVVVLLGVVVLRGGAQEVRDMDATHAEQDLLAVALETDLVGGSTLWLGGLETMPLGIEARLDAAGQDLGLRPSIDCDRLGDTIDPDEIDPALAPGVVAEVVRLIPIGDMVPGAMRFDGWIDGSKLDCVVLVDMEGTVVGAAGHGRPSGGYGQGVDVDRAGRVWFSGIAPRRDGTTVYVRLEGGDHFVALPYRG